MERAALAVAARIGEWKRAMHTSRAFNVLIVAGHGGNECGVFKALNPKLDIITFGPIGKDVHTPEEKLDLESFERSYQMLKKLVSMCD